MKRILTAFFAVVLLIACIPLMPIQAEASSTNGIQAKLDKLKSVYYTGTYFTKSGNAAHYTNESESHINNIPARGGLPAGSSLGINGTSCWAFAQYCFCYIYGTNFYNANVVSKPSFGDAVAFNGGTHYAIYLGEDSNNYYVYDANYGYYCAVRYNGALTKSGHTITTVYHAKNYDQVYGTSSQPTIKYTSFAKGVYYIKNNSNGKYLSVSEAKDAQGQGVNTWVYNGYVEQQMEFISASSGYKIHPLCSTSRVINANGVTVAAGQNVDIWNDVNDGTQWWGFEKVSGGYVIRNMQDQNCVLGLASNNTDVVVETYTGAKDQIWTITLKDCKHSAYNVSVTKEATCTATGTKKYTCQSCGYSYTETIAKTGHTYSALNTKVYAATCTKQGYTEKRCSCGYVYTGNYTSALGHNYANGKCTRCSNTPTGVKITKQPANASAYKNENAVVTVTATGDGLTYQWYYKHTDMSSFSKAQGYTSKTFTNKMVAACHGEKVYCVVTDKYGNSVQTNTVTLTLKNKATITKQPANASAYKNENAVVTVTATGDGLTYQWYYKHTDMSSFSKAQGYTSKTFTNKMVAACHGEKIYCVVTDKYGNSVQTNTVTLTLKNKATITKQPANITGAKGATVKTSVTASGDGLSYTWYFKNKGASSYSKSSTTTNTYSMTLDATRSGRQVYCVVKDKYGNTVKSNVVTLSIKQTAKITKQPANVSAAKGATVKTTVTAVGDGATYTWYYKNKGASSYSKSSITTNTYSVTMDSTRAGRQVYCVVKDKYGNSVKSNVVTLSMKTVAKITKQPANATAAKGATVKTTVTAVGDGATYTWYFKNKGASSYTKSSITGKTYSMTMDATRNGRQVYCVVKDKYGNSVKSNVVTLSMKSVAKITKQPTSVTVASGATAKTSVTATGDGLSYTWYYKNKTASGFAKSSITTNTYTMTMDSTRAGRQVFCIVTDKYGNTLTTNVVTLNKK